MGSFLIHSLNLTVMATVNQNAELTEILKRLLEKGTSLPANAGAMVNAFLFESLKDQELSALPQLMGVLTYLKNVVTRNGFKNAKDLMHYYEKKRKKMHEVANGLKDTGPEDILAIRFHASCVMHMTTKQHEHLSK